MQSRKVATRSVATTVSAIALTMLMTAPALADTVTFHSITGFWHDVVPANTADLTFIPNPQPPAAQNVAVFWGEPVTAAGQSGYRFQGNAPPAFDVAVNPPPASGNFDLGTFTHINQPISLAPDEGAFSIESVMLTVIADLSVDGVPQGLQEFTFQFLHDETNNAANPCEYGGANGQGVNANGCADQVQVNGTDASDTFTVNGVEYTLNISGFRADGNFVTEFLTREGQENPAVLVANLQVAQVMPEPASLAVLGSALAALGGIGLFRRRRTHNAA